MDIENPRDHPEHRRHIEEDLSGEDRQNPSVKTKRLEAFGGCTGDAEFESEKESGKKLAPREVIAGCCCLAVQLSTAQG